MKTVTLKVVVERGGERREFNFNKEESGVPVPTPEGEVTLHLFHHTDQAGQWFFRPPWEMVNRFTTVTGASVQNLVGHFFREGTPFTTKFGDDVSITAELILN